MPLVIRSEVRYLPDASRIQDCSQNYIVIPRKLISETYNPIPASIVSGKVMGVSVIPSDDLILESSSSYSSVIRDFPVKTRLIKGENGADYLFIFLKDWHKLSKRFVAPGRKFIVFMASTLFVGKKKMKLYPTQSIYWEEDEQS